ncbi:MAG: addiction module antitoxin RelB [Sandaracinaceae bacterium]|nr:MAG: addiction module antitoxin RelB [Sandaracinaceae bacterium]
MSSSAKKLLDEALTLPEADRRRLAEALLDSVPRRDAASTRRAWVQEARRRAEADQGESVDLDNAFADLRAQLRSSSSR